MSTILKANIGKGFSVIAPEKYTINKEKIKKIPNNL
tara:strand:+ start:112 stop:219 length:108 start_codon:yes stop_codon:yes gene_type:complete